MKRFIMLLILLALFGTICWGESTAAVLDASQNLYRCYDPATGHTQGFVTADSLQDAQAQCTALYGG